ncbi:T9SS type A sorting domain-containing protein [Lacinutrix sp. WUR7]|uniref:T9SS type A sorting domain-containing protein n=1 Tax=Lacinutrix sp. WUR7 TaxID=2653681 RepID=UPI00193E0001|nr:T9SS type A sorting domain-containing protein [Lacinutrix sp. WUR7]QRM89659.1 T9SS type A sorting domain-containing protein [Lacinutrix sp. WUR7]
MKKKLLYLACLATSLTFAQSITNFNSSDMSIYAVVDGTVDQSPTGASTTWSFTSLTSTGTNADTYAAPTGAQTSSFPGTTYVFSSGDNDILLKSIAGELSITGAVTPGLELNYITDNALIGAFPLSFGDNNSDPVAGTFNSGTASGTFSGNIVKMVDGYGTLSMNVVGSGTYSGTVTRLKMLQTVTLDLPPFLNNAGTATQTSYYYYDNSNGNLVFRSNTININIPIVGMDETTTVNEVYLVTLLGLEENVYNEISLVPNPVQSILNVNLKSPTTINAIVISDINGRRVLSTTNNTTAIDVSVLQAGMYIVQVQTDRAVLTKKFIKK